MLRAPFTRLVLSVTAVAFLGHPSLTVAADEKAKDDKKDVPVVIADEDPPLETTDTEGASQQAVIDSLVGYGRGTGNAQMLLAAAELSASLNGAEAANKIIDEAVALAPEDKSIAKQADNLREKLSERPRGRGTNHIVAKYPFEPPQHFSIRGRRSLTLHKRVNNRFNTYWAFHFDYSGRKHNFDMQISRPGSHNPRHNSFRKTYITPDFELIGPSEFLNSNGFDRFSLKYFHYFKDKKWHVVCTFRPPQGIEWDYTFKVINVEGRQSPVLQNFRVDNYAPLVFRN